MRHAVSIGVDSRPPSPWTCLHCLLNWPFGRCGTVAMRARRMPVFPV